MPPRPWLREPLVHFALGGVLLFAAHRWLAADPATTIRISSDTLDRLRAQQTRKLGREPEPSEVQAAIEAWAADEVLHREALALGLDRGDPIVRRRLIQKMNFVLEGGAGPEPSEAELEAWVESHPDAFTREPAFSFVHVFIADTSAEPPAELALLEGRLAAGDEPSELGQPSVHGSSIGPQTAAEVGRRFGSDFAEGLAKLPREGWHRLRSSHGWHLVRIDEVVPGGRAALDQVRARAREDLLAERREAERVRRLAQVRERYEIVVEDQAG